MPIHPDLRHLYPPDWRTLANWVKFERAGGRCERCGRPHGVRVLVIREGGWLDPETGERFDAPGAGAGPLPPVGLASRAVRDHDPDLRPPRPEPGEQRPGWGLIFEQGRYDGFSPDEVELRLELTGEICRAVADDAFQSVMRLRSDFSRGRFAPAFQTERRATVYEPAYRMPERGTLK